MPPGKAPSVRASHLKDRVWALATLGPSASRVRARLRPETVATIEAARGTEHLPIALHVELAQAVFAEVGADGTRRWGTESLLHSFEGFLKPLVVGLTKLFGTTPATLFKAFPQGWSGTFRGAGHVTVTHPGEGLTRVFLRELPAELRGIAFLSGVAGSLETAFRISPYDGRAVLEPREPDAPEASWLVEWHPRKK